MAGTVTVSRTRNNYNKSDMNKFVEVVQVHWVADASAATVPNASFALQGYVLRAVTVPSAAVAPTSLYDIIISDALDSSVTLDIFEGAIINRSATLVEQKAVFMTGAGFPLFLSGTYTFKLSNNSVNSASGDLYLYMVDG